MKRNMLMIGLAIVLLATMLVFACKKDKSKEESTPSASEASATSDQTFTCVSKISEKLECELYFVRHANGDVDVYKTVRALKQGTNVNVYSLDLPYTVENGITSIPVPSSPSYVKIPFDDTKNFAPVGGLTICVRCECCSGTGGSGAGACENVNDGNLAASCRNSGCGKPGDDPNSVSCGTEPCTTGDDFPRTGVVILRADAGHVTIHD